MVRRRGPSTGHVARWVEGDGEAVERLAAGPAPGVGARLLAEQVQRGTVVEFAAIAREVFAQQLDTQRTHSWGVPERRVQLGVAGCPGGAIDLCEW